MANPAWTDPADWEHKARCIECEGEGCFEHPRLQGAYGDSHAESPPDPVLVDCEHCHGTGECACDECVNTAAENAFSDMCESEPPLSADERYQAAARQKRELRR
jgi:hypothetical protein